jgi:hypothetical protein
MGARDGEFRGRFFGLEVNHKFPFEIETRPDALKARQLLASINFDVESAVNKKPLFVSEATRNAIKATPEIAEVFRKAGVGFNVHDSRQGSHPGYSDFVLGALNSLGVQAEAEGWNFQARERAVFHLLMHVDGINDDGIPPIYGSSADDFRAQWDSVKLADYSNTNDPEIVARIDACRNSADIDLYDKGSNYNSSYRYKVISDLVLNCSQL